MDTIDIRVGRSEDRHAITEFALSMSEDPSSSISNWLERIDKDDFYSVIASYKHNIVGKLHARKIDSIGWLESTQVSPEFRKLGIANALVDAALDWLIGQGVKEIRTMVDSDNLSGRRIMEKQHFLPQFLAINPSAKITEEHTDPSNTDSIAAVLDEELFHTFKPMIDRDFSGNLMIDNSYMPVTQELFTELIQQKRVFTNQSENMMLIVSQNNLPSEFQGFLVADDIEGYMTGGKALKGLGARELGTLAVCHASTKRAAQIGLAQVEFGWMQPHSLIIYGRNSWQHANDLQD